jgi:allophanate hydrolase subunit 2
VKPVAALPGMEKRKFIPKASDASPKILRVIFGPQEDYFTEDGMHTFVTETYKLTNDSNRMACKLSGPVIESRKTTDIISDGISLGSIQVSSNGQPMIMLSDRQTTGGYAKIGTVISSDISMIAQCKPGDEIKFISITLKEAQRLYKKHIKASKKFENKMIKLR